MPTERLFSRLPAHVRVRDAAEGHPLRALLAIAEAELDLLEDDVRQLYDNAFVETCEEWVVPYIGDLLGARRLDPAGGETFSLRAYVANQLAYRRAKGTAAVVQRIARDVTGHPARVVEYWQHLVQSQHVNHVRPDCRQTADLRDADRASLTDTPFDRFAHNVDVRPIAKREGRHAIPNVGVFLWRLLAAPVGFAFDDPAGVMGGVTPRPLAPADGRFRLHPAGVDSPLFNRPRPDGGGEERDLPAPLRRRPLWHELEDRRAGSLDPARWFGDQPVFQVRLDGATLPPERLRIAHLGEQTGGDWRRPLVAGDVMVDPELGRLSLHPDDAGLAVEVAYAVGAVAEVGAGPWDRRTSLVGWLDGFAPTDAEAPWICAVTRRTSEHNPDPDTGGPCVGSLAAALQLWNTEGNVAGRRGLVVILDNASYDEPLPAIALAADAGLALVAAGWPASLEASGARRRRLADLVPVGRRPFVDATLEITAADGAFGLVVDGLMTAGAIRLGAGTLERLAVHHATLGATAAGLTTGLEVDAGAGIARIEIDSSVVGAFALPPTVGALVVTDSLIGEDREADAGAGVLSTATAIDAEGTDVAVHRSTVFGRIRARTADLDRMIATGRVRALRRQEGCVRYSFVPLGSRTAPRFRCQPDLALEAATAELRALTENPAAQLTDDEAAAVARRTLPRFTSTRFEHPAFGQLGALCTDAVRRGGEAGGEMGAFARLGLPIRQSNLKAALEDTLRVGLEAGVFRVT
jgi:hypothetical protein